MQRGAAGKPGPIPSFEQWAAAADALTHAFERLHLGAAGAHEDVKRLSCELQRLNQQLSEPAMEPLSHKHETEP